jgi:hypothetical protein
MTSSNYKNITQSTLIKTTAGVLKGMYVNSTNAGTIRFGDGQTTTTAGVKATATLTITGAIGNNETVTIGGQTYTFKTALTAGTTANEVLIGASDAIALDNLKSAIDKSAGGGTTYGSDTVANAYVDGSTNGDTTQVVAAKTVGFHGNLIGVSTTLANGSWGEDVTTLSGGYDAAPLINNTITPAVGYHNLGNVSFNGGLYATIGGTALDVTLHYE